MRLSSFIARRLAARRSKSFSRTIIRIAIAAIALSVAVMLLSTAFVDGFKRSITDKVFGFWGHIHITDNYAGSRYAFDVRPLNKDQSYYPSMDTLGPINYYSEEKIWGLFPWKGERMTKGGVAHIQIFANKEGIIKTNDQIEGIILRGIGEDYDWSYLQECLQEGQVLDLKTDSLSEGILISQTTANRLKVGLNEQFLVYFVQDGQSLSRRFTVRGIYKTGLAEYDRMFALVDIRRIQQLNGWRPFHNFGTELYLADDDINLYGLSPQSARRLPFLKERLLRGDTLDWSVARPHPGIIITEQVAQRFKLDLGDSLRLTYSEWELRYQWPLVVTGIYRAPEDVAMQKTCFVDWQQLQQLNERLPEQVGGFEIFLDDIQDMEVFGNYVNYNVLLGKEQYANTIREIEPSIFDWLSLTNLNEQIILALMILVSIINMSTALMILILERTNMIGVLKALGAHNWTIRRVFLWQAAYTIGQGLLFGNMLGIGLGLLQQQFGFIQLNEELYYVSSAPIYFDWLTVFAINIGTLLVTLLVLIIPSWLVARIDPVKAIRFK